jgi:hypothetical protein
LVEEAGATFTTSCGKAARLTEPNQVVCISPTGAVSYSSSSTSILGFQLAQQAPRAAAIRDYVADGSASSALRVASSEVSAERSGASRGLIPVD